MENQLFADINQFLRTQVQPEKVVLVATSDRYTVFRSGKCLIVEDKHLQTKIFMPMIGDLNADC